MFSREVVQTIFGASISLGQSDLADKLLRFLKAWDDRHYNPRNTVSAINQFYGDSDEVAEAIYAAWNELVKANYLVRDHHSVIGEWFVLSTKAQTAEHFVVPGAEVLVSRPSATDLSSPQGPTTPEGIAEKTKTVMVAYGRDRKLKDAMFDFLREVGLNPIEWEEGVRRTGIATPYIGQILDAIFNYGQAVVVVFSGDDLAKLRDDLGIASDGEVEKILRPQPRPNVIFEAGMAFGRRPDQTILVEVGNLRPISDLGGRHVVRFDGGRESRKILVNRLETAHCQLTLRGESYLDMDLAYDFSKPSGKGGAAKAPDAQASNKILGIIDRELTANARKLRQKAGLGASVGPHFITTDYDPGIEHLSVAVLEQFQHSPELDPLDPQARALIADAIGQLRTMTQLEAHFRSVRARSAGEARQARYDLRNSAGPALAAVERALEAVRSAQEQ